MNRAGRWCGHAFFHLWYFVNDQLWILNQNECSNIQVSIYFILAVIMTVVNRLSGSGGHLSSSFINSYCNVSWSRFKHCIEDPCYICYNHNCPQATAQESHLFHQAGYVCGCFLWWSIACPGQGSNGETIARVWCQINSWLFTLLGRSSLKKKWKYGFRPNFLLTSPLKFGSKNRYQSPKTVPRTFSQYYQNWY